ncbi:MAG: hypothetical protein EOO98_04105 [Pedobacter sp.]|nr:MAG: hypothetical protein EOO98_04105 [Pedobacter sp.]
MKKLVLLCFLALALAGCKKDKFSPPEIQTLSVIANSPGSASFTGNILTVGNQSIKDYGFIYSVSSPQIDDTNGIKVSLGNSPTKGEFSKTVDNITASAPYYNNTIWVRAYITDEKGTVFGSTVNAALPRPTSSGASISSGRSGDVVKFYGKFYNPTVANVTVTFQSVRAKVISVSDTEIAVEVPVGISAYHGQSIPVSITIGGSMVNNSMSFTILANVKDFTPKSGIVGSNITLTGDNMPNGYYSSSGISVYFNNVLGSTINYSSQTMIPYTVSQTFAVSVVVGGQQKVLPGEFTVTAPQITSVTPENVLPGQNITISGNNFATQYDSSTGRPMAKLGNGSYVNVSPYSNSFSFTVPTNTTEDEHTLYFKVGPHEVQAPKKIKVLALNATSFSPASGGVGREINITGNFVQGQNYNVSFGTVTYYASANSSTNLRVLVPSGVNVGKVKITVDFGTKKVTLPGDFEVLGPSFTSFSPTSGVAGTLITLKGTGFIPNYNYNSVKFGTVLVTPVSVTDNTIVVAVPSNVSPGAMKLSVVFNGQTVVHPDNFTITN